MLDVNYGAVNRDFWNCAYISQRGTFSLGIKHTEIWYVECNHIRVNVGRRGGLDLEPRAAPVDKNMGQR